jgi:hypothetical protein
MVPGCGFKCGFLGFQAFAYTCNVYRYFSGMPSQSTKDGVWWVNAKFQWGGLVGSARERSADVPKDNTRGFTEDDQEALFHSVGACTS